MVNQLNITIIKPAPKEAVTDGNAGVNCVLDRADATEPSRLKSYFRAHKSEREALALPSHLSTIRRCSAIPLRVATDRANALQPALVTLVVGALLWAGAGQTAHAATSVTIAAAANLERILSDKLIPAFTAKTGVEIVPDYAATGLLAKQMEQSAPFEVFVSADTATVDKLVAEKVLDGATEQPYAVGQLVLWTRADSKYVPSAVGDLTSAAITHIAIANPKTAPYGAAAMESLAKSGLLATVQPKIVYGENIQQALQLAKSGNADVAFTALSLVIGGKDGVYTIVPASLHAPIVQSVALRTSASAAARHFEAFLLSRDAAPVWKSYGYLPPK